MKTVELVGTFAEFGRDKSSEKNFGSENAEESEKQEDQTHGINEEQKYKKDKV